MLQLGQPLHEVFDCLVDLLDLRIDLLNQDLLLVPLLQLLLDLGHDRGTPLQVVPSQTLKRLLVGLDIFVQLVHLALELLVVLLDDIAPVDLLSKGGLHGGLDAAVIPPCSSAGCALGLLHLFDLLLVPVGPLLQSLQQRESARLVVGHDIIQHRAALAVAIANSLLPQIVEFLKLPRHLGSKGPLVLCLPRLHLLPPIQHLQAGK
mmetsp:Transcript_8448/g.24221  ORF Transcript_8448/g.24221 Transcript_8448/m.24221 type:complete len:206 (-) Transcript_8448:977-1594(-)